MLMRVHRKQLWTLLVVQGALAGCIAADAAWDAYIQSAYVQYDESYSEPYGEPLPRDASEYDAEDERRLDPEPEVLLGIESIGVGKCVGTSSGETGEAGTLRASLDGPAAYYFQYGRGLLYGSETARHEAGPGIHEVAADVVGLEPYSTYDCRLVATNAEGTSYGENGTFLTAASPRVMTAPPAGRARARS